MSRKLKIAPLIVILTICGFSRASQDSNSFFYDNLKLVGVSIRQPGYHVWGSSPIIGPKGKFHLFAARWPVSAKFVPGWKTHSEVAHYLSDSAEGPFSFCDIAITGTGKDTWDKQGAHNPTVHKVGDAYYIFYIANPGLKGFPANQRIGLAKAKSLHGPWTRVGKDGLILSPSEDPNNFTYKSIVGVNNPAFLQHPNGKYYLYFKIKRSKGQRRQMGVAISDNVEGPYKIYPRAVVGNVELNMGVEDGYAFVYQDNCYFLATGGLEKEDFHGGILWSSKDGLSFSDPKKGFNSLRHHRGGSLPPESKHYYQRAAKFERPQVLMVDGRPAYLYAPSGTNPEGGDGTMNFVFKIFGIPSKNSPCKGAPKTNNDANSQNRKCCVSPAPAS